MISHLWFESQIPFMQDLLKNAIEPAGFWRVIRGPGTGRGGKTPDPYVGLVAKENPLFSVSAGCRNSFSPYGTRPFAYVGIRSYPEFGGKGSTQLRGTLQEGVDWCMQNQHHFLSRVPDRQSWQGADFQWAMWKYVVPAEQTEAYAELLVAELLSLAEVMR